MTQPFKVRHIREFGDGTCQLEAYDLPPGFSTSDLLSYVLTRTTEVGKIFDNDKCSAVVEYSRGKITNLFILKNEPIKRLTLFGGYNVWDYVFEV